MTMQLAQLPTPVPVDDGGLFAGLGFLAILLFLFVPVSSAFFTAWLADERGHQRNLWFVLGFFFGPLALLAVGFAPARGSRQRDEVVSGPAARPAAYEPARHEPSPYEPSPYEPSPYESSPYEPPRPQPLTTTAPYEPVREPPVGVDIDAVVFHEPSQQGYGRGRIDDGSWIYFRVTRDELRDLTDRLRTQRPYASFVSRSDVVQTYDLPPELRPAD